MAKDTNYLNDDLVLAGVLRRFLGREDNYVEAEVDLLVLDGMMWGLTLSEAALIHRIRSESD